MSLPEMTEEEKRARVVKMREIAAEFEALFRKHDLAGTVNFADKQMGHFLYVVDPTWSIARIESGQFKLSLKKPAEGEEQSSFEEDKAKLQDTVSMLATLLHLADHTQKNFLSLLLTLKAHMQIDTEIEEVPQPDENPGTDSDG